MSEERGGEPSFEGGSHSVKEKRAEVPKAGRTAGQTFIVIVCALVLLAAVLWLIVPFGG